MAFVVLPGADASGNGNDWTVNNINSTVSTATTYDIMTDVPTLTDEDTANYAVMNPLDLASTSTVMSDGNLKVSHTGAIWNADRATVGVSSGKWYWEVTVNVVGFTFAGGVMKTELAILNNTFPGNGSYPSGSSFGYYFTGGKYGGGLNNAAYGASYTNGDTIGTALDLDAGTITFYKNGVSQGVAWTGLSGEFAPATGLYSTSNHDVNFGQRPFAYTPPAGFKKLNTFNLPDSNVLNGKEYFNTNTYSGNGSTQTITNGLFSPDLMWVKCRNAGHNHVLQDTVRGVGSGKNLSSNQTQSEGTDNDGYMLATTSTGFTVNAGNGTNNSGLTYVGWQWRGSDSTAVSNTDGTIASQVSANPTAGFSVVTYTGTGVTATVGHGLGVAPKMIIVKSRSGGGSSYTWGVYHASTGATKYFELNTTAAVAIASTPWNNTAPTSSVFNIGTWTSVNTNTQTYVAYCFADVEGYSKMGSYAGNGSADGPFIYTGFRPAFIMFRSTILCHWVIVDNARSTYNVVDDSLYTDTGASEATTITDVDFLSNGFKWRGVLANETNVSGQTYVYMAFAENPFKNSLAR